MSRLASTLLLVTLVGIHVFPALLAFVAVAMMMAAPLPAQASPTSGAWAAVPVAWTWSSGPQSNGTGAPIIAAATVVSAPGASSMRVFFGNALLPDGATMVVRSNLDGETHKLDAFEMARWEQGSAWLNGAAVTVELHLAPGASGACDVTGLLVAGLFGSPETLCGNDDRVLTTDTRVARLVMNDGFLCTAALIGGQGCFLSAGHCFQGTTAGVGQFNVPPSTAGGAIVQPPVSSQFPIMASTVMFNNGNVGDDWSVGRLGNNSSGQGASQLYGWFTPRYQTPSSGTQLRIPGYGLDSGVRNHVLQVDTGPSQGGQGSSILAYSVDTEPGNSGSPVIHVPSGEVVAVHTNGGCNSSSSSSNAGTLLSRSSLMSAINQVCVQLPPVASFTRSPIVVSPGVPVSFTDTSLGNPTSWSWDFDNDGTTDSTQQNPTWSYPNNGVFAVRLTVTNPYGSDSILNGAAVIVTPPVSAALPYTQDFNAGIPIDGSWTFTSSNPSGAIAFTQLGAVSPGSGGDALTMASSQNGVDVVNEATLHIDFLATGGGRMAYWYRETSDENHPEDGVFLSDGTVEIQARSHNSGPQAWTRFEVDLTDLVLTTALNPSPQLRIIFRQRDDFILGNDGVFIDDVEIWPDLAFTFATTGVQDLQLDLPLLPAATAEGFTLLSLDVSAPVGTGAFFGLAPDLVSLDSVLSPPTPTNPLHFVPPFVPGLYPAGPLNLGPGALASLTGITLDGMVLLLDAQGGFLSWSRVRRVTF